MIFRHLLIIALGTLPLMSFAESADWQGKTCKTISVNADNVDCSLISEVHSNAASYDLIRKKILGESAGAGQLSLYSHGDEIRSLGVLHYGEMGKRSIEYFYKNGELLIISDQIINYDRPAHLDGVEIDTKEEELYFLTNNELKQVVIQGKYSVEVEKHKAHFEELVEQSKEYSQKARACNN